MRETGWRPAWVMTLGAVVLLATWAAPATARAQQDYSDKDFSVRLAPAYLRFTEQSAMGGETFANRYSPAINPASADWFHLPTGHGLTAAPHYSQVTFDNGTDLHLAGGAAMWNTDKYGTFQPTVDHIWTNSRPDRATGLDFDYRVDSAQLQWGKRLGNCAVGAAFNIAEVDMSRDGRLMRSFGPFTVPVLVDTDASAESYRWRFGGLYQPADKWLLGAIVEYGVQPYRSRATSTVVLPQGPPMVTVTRDEGTQQQFVFRPGVSYEFAPLSTVYLDYQVGDFVNPRDELVDQRFNAGVEYRLLKPLLVRVGPSVDVRGNVGLSCGASLFLAEWASLEVGYQYNLLPELVPEFGRAQTLQFALAVRF